MIRLRVEFVTAILAIAISASPGAETARRIAHESTAETTSAKEMLWWLPADTESVVAARGPFLIRAGSNNDEKNEKEWFTKRASQLEVRSAFEQLPLEVFYDLNLEKVLRGYTVTAAMQGSRHFREPKGASDVMDFEGCSIVVFEEDLGGLEGPVGQMLAEKATDREVIGGTQVLIFGEEAVENHFVALPQRNVLLVGNNRRYFKEVLERMAERRTPRALPEQLPEWRYLDANAEFWGLRHYDPQQAGKDPTSPFSEDRTFDPGDKKAIGVLFEPDPRGERSAAILFFKGGEVKVEDEAAAGVYAVEPQEGVKYQVRVRNRAPGVLEVSYTLDRSSTLDYFILVVMMALGRGMYF